MEEPIVSKCFHCGDYHRIDTECSQAKLAHLGLHENQAWFMFTILLERHEARIAKDTQLIAYYKNRAEKAEKELKDAKANNDKRSTSVGQDNVG